MNVMNDIAQKNNIQIGYYNRENILRIFKLIDQLSPEVNIGRRQIIIVNFILKQLFNILGIEYNFIALTRSKNTLKYSGQRWERVYAFLLYRHECFAGKYTTRKIHKNYIRDPSGLFSTISQVSLSMT